jgi:hypothetical protein
MADDHQQHWCYEALVSLVIIIIKHESDGGVID